MFSGKSREKKAEELRQKHAAQWKEMKISEIDLAKFETRIHQTQGLKMAPDPYLFGNQTRTLNQELLQLGFNFAISYSEMMGVLIDLEDINRRHRSENKRVLTPIELAVYKRAMAIIRQEHGWNEKNEVPDDMMAKRVEKLMADAKAIRESKNKITQI